MHKPSCEKGASAIAAQQHILRSTSFQPSPPTPVDTFPSVSGAFRAKSPLGRQLREGFLLYCVETYVILGLRPFSDPSVAERR